MFGAGIGSKPSGPAAVIALQRDGRETAPLHIFSASFHTLEGATAALCQLGDARSHGLIDLENAVALTRAKSGRIAFLSTDALPGWPGCGRGALITGILALCFLTAEVESMARASYVTGLHNAGFEHDDLHALAKELVWGTSLLMAVVDQQRVETVDDVLNEVAVKIGWALMNVLVADLVQQYGLSHRSFMDAS